MLKRIDPFVPLILLMILMARLFPEWGIARDWINPSQIANWGVCIVFFFYGLKLNGQKIKQGIYNYKLHILIQLTTFVLFPLLVLPFMPKEPSALWLGVFFVAALPSTVSSSVVMVSIARGNIPGAIFNSSISSLLGVVLTPAIMSLYLTSDLGSEPIEQVVVKLILQVIIPVGLGMFLNRWWGDWAEKHKGKLRWYDQCVILTIVWSAFCEGYNSGVFTSVGVSTMLKLIG
ncbi:MAG: bile acid:sodium symporter, partial [Rikenellaceae bacterium]